MSVGGAGKLGAGWQPTTLTTSRLLDFTTVKELTAQTGHEPRDWPLVALKELVDNALDASEEAGLQPQIHVKAGPHYLVVSDRGPGLPVETIEGVLDYSVRVSSREAYVSPTRGAQGNALKTILAMPFVLDGEQGRVVIMTQGGEHTVTFRVDRIKQEPVITHDHEPGPVRSGTVVWVQWPERASSIMEQAKAQFLQIVIGYIWLNPHLTLTVDWQNERTVFEASDPSWEKWGPSHPSSPHWYEVEHLERLIAAYVTHDARAGRSRTVREFVTEFRGLSGTAKQSAVLGEVGLAYAPLSDLAQDGAIDRAKVTALLRAMQRQSSPVKPELLGPVGKPHWQACLEAWGCEEESIEVKQVKGTDSSGVPWVIEAAFGWVPDKEGRSVIAGVNWSPAIINPFRKLGAESLDDVLTRQWIRPDDPVVVALHLIHPRVGYTDRGKSAVALPFGVTREIVRAVEAVTQRWARQRKAEERNRNAVLKRRDVMLRRKKVFIKDAAWEVMEEAYLKASAGGTLPANARQIMYAARPAILEMTGNAQLDDNYFTQNLLPTYMAEEEVDWDVVFDARGRLTEPHTGREIQLGTIQVRRYLQEVESHSVEALSFDVSQLRYPTKGPENRFSAVLFIEKEGFDPLLKAVDLAKRWDVAVMSTKGMSSTASRQLIQALSEHDVPVLVLHDFDVSGFSIFGTMAKSGQRFQYTRTPKVIDLGLRLRHVDGLESEEVTIKNPDATSLTLRSHGATEEEVAFLLDRRVELNALASGDLVAFIERKLKKHGVRKVVPDQATLTNAYRRMRRQATVQARIDEVLGDPSFDAGIEAPKGLRNQVAAILRDEPALSWDEALLRIVGRDREGD